MRAFLLVVALHTGGGHGGRDPWFAPDKLKHFFMSAFVQSVAYSGLRLTRLDHQSSILGASAVTVAVGVGKEIVDARGRGDPSLKDLVWDGLGAGGATLVLGRAR